MKRWVVLAGVAAFAVAIALSVGLGVGLTNRHSDDKESSSSPETSPLPDATNSNRTTTASLWTPHLNDTWDYQLQLVPETFNGSISVYDIDLFDASTSDIEELHNQQHKVICYFSAGSYEDWRPDKLNFTSSDLGKALDGWAGEKWVDTNSHNVRNIMVARIEMAAAKNCDGVDPDNIDAYDNDNGLGLTENDAVNYVNFLSETAHSFNLSVGLKNGGAIVEKVVNVTQWVVVEQCIQYDECEMYRPFVDAEKPVFNVEYPSLTKNLNSSEIDHYCHYNESVGFMTILKNMDLDLWVALCPFR